MAQEITIEELERITGPKRVIDIRSREAFEKGTFPFAESIPLEELKPEIIAADTTMPVYLFCHTENPQIEKNIFRSVENVNLDTVIAYKQGRTRHHFLDSYV